MSSKRRYPKSICRLFQKSALQLILSLLCVALIVIPGGFLSAKSTKQAERQVYFPVEYEGAVIEVPAVEYITCCALLAAGDRDGDTKALMQAVCILVHTNAWYLLQRMEVLPANGYGQLWQSKEAVQERFGEKTYNKWYTAAVEIQNVVLTYGGEPILAAYYPGGFGVSESALAAWGVDLPYLTHMRTADLSDIGQTAVIRYRIKQLQERIGGRFTADEIRVLSRGESAKVGRIAFGDMVLDGVEAAGRLKLPSEIFSLRQEGDFVIFSCFGKGEIVGLSLSGARALAGDGLSARELLAQYYPKARWTELQSEAAA